MMLTSTAVDLVNISMANAGIVAVLGYAVVFFGLILLMCVITVMGKIFIARDKKAAEKGMIVALNPSPYDARIAEYDMNCVNYLLVNEVEGEQVTGCSEPDAIADKLKQLYPNMNLVLTLGSRGAIFCGADGSRHATGIYRSHAVDTTAAGDTFTGYFLAQITETGDGELALKQASVASGISVSRKGASPSIPMAEEVRAVGLDVLQPIG